MKLTLNFKKNETEYDAMRQDLRTLNKKNEEGVQKCLDLTTHQQTMSEIKDEIAEVKTVPLAEIMKQELEKSLDNMVNEISTVKTNLHETKEVDDDNNNNEIIGSKHDRVACHVQQNKARTMMPLIAALETYKHGGFFPPWYK